MHSSKVKYINALTRHINWNQSNLSQVSSRIDQKVGRNIYIGEESVDRSWKCRVVVFYCDLKLFFPKTSERIKCVVRRSFHRFLGRETLLECVPFPGRTQNSRIGVETWFKIPDSNSSTSWGQTTQGGCLLYWL